MIHYIMFLFPLVESVTEQGLSLFNSFLSVLYLAQCLRHRKEVFNKFSMTD